MPLLDLLVNCSQIEEKDSNLRLSQYKPTKLKDKEDKDEKYRTHHKTSIKDVMRTPEEEERHTKNM